MYHVQPLVETPDSPFPRSAGGGLYAFTRPNPGIGKQEVLYVGETNSFVKRLPSHEKLAEARARGCTTIESFPVQGHAQRKAAEKALIQALQPRMNDKLNPLWQSSASRQQIEQRMRNEAQNAAARRFLAEVHDVLNDQPRSFLP